MKPKSKNSSLNNMHSELSIQNSTLKNDNSTFNTQHSTLKNDNSTFNTQHSTLKNDNLTLNIQHSTLKNDNLTLNIQHSTLPKGWVWVRLGEVADIYPGYGFPKNLQGKKSGKYPFYKVGDISKNVALGYKFLEFCENYIDDDDLNKLKAKPYPNGTIVFAKVGEALKLNRRAILKKEGLVDNNAIGVKANENICCNNYFFYFLTTLKLEDYSRATTVPSVRKSDIELILLPLPPLAEQQRIVAKIEELFSKLDAGVEALKKAKEQIKRYRQAVLKYAFEGKLTEEWRKNNVELLMLNDELKQTQNSTLNIKHSTLNTHHSTLNTQNSTFNTQHSTLNTQHSTLNTQHSTLNTQHSTLNTQHFEPAEKLLEKIKAERKKKLGKKYKEMPPIDTSELPELPEGWAWVRLGEIADFKNGINFNKNQKGTKGILTIDVLNMYSQGIFVDLNNLYRVNKQVDDDYILKYGDILFVRSSVKREGVGWTSAFKEFEEPVTYCGFIIRARLHNYQILPEFITYFFRTNFAREIIVEKGSQVTITNISQDSLAKITIPIAPFPEQQLIVDEIERRFSIADEVEKAIDNSLKQAERLRQSILKKAFEGKLVPQDPNDEPAEKLLKRILNVEL